MPFLDDVFEELDAVRSYVNARDNARYRARLVSQQRARQMNDVADRYPHMTPDAFMALARSQNFGADTARKLGELSARQWMSRHPGGTRYGQDPDTPGMRRDRRKTNIFSQTADLLGENRQVTTQQEMAALPSPARKEFNDAIDQAEQVGLFDKDDVLHEPEKDDRNRRAAFDRLTKAFIGAGQDLQYLGADGRPTRMFGSEGTTRSRIQVDEGTDKERSKWIDNFHLAGDKQIIGYDPKTDPVRVELKRRRQERMGPTGFAALARAAFTTFDMPVQELQGQIRNIYGATHGKKVDWLEPQSDLIIQAQTGLSAGSGYFVDPESEVAQERRRREAERGKIGGHNVTAGRWFADAFPVDPDTRPFQMISGAVDLGVQMADPTAFVLGTAGKAGMSRRLFQAPEAEESAGLIRGLKNAISGPAVKTWLDSKDGVARIGWLRDHNDVYEVWRGLNRKVNFDLAGRLADTRTDQEVRAILEQELGKSIREVSTVSMGLPGQEMLREAQVRKITDMPSRGPIDAHNKDIVGRELEKWLSIGKADDEVIAKHVGAVARAQTPLEINIAVRDALTAEEGLLRQAGINEGLAKRLTKLHETAHREGSRTWVDAISHQGQTDDMIVIGGEPGWDAGAHLYVEHAPESIKLPDARDIRRVQSRFSTILAQGDTGKLRVPFATAEFLQNELWKPFQLAFRIAWPVRVIAEEQIRMAAAGYDSMFRHPLSFIATRVGHKADTDVVGDLIGLADEAKAAQAIAHGGWVEHAVPVGKKTLWYKADGTNREHFTTSLGSEIARLANDPVGREVARAGSLDEVKTWFSQGAGQKWSGQLARAHKSKWDRLGGADGYVESLQRRIHNATGGDARLLEAVRTGKWDGKDLLDGTHLDADFVKAVDELPDDIKPSAIVGDEFVEAHPRGAEILQRWDATVDKLFGLLMTNRTNNLSRVPHFKQAYWKEAERLLGFTKLEERAAFLEAAKEANLDGWRLGSRTMRRLERSATRHAAGDLTLEELDVLAKGHALDSTKELLYDLTKRGKGMDAWRLIFPFGEAWKEVVTRWFGADGLLWRNPKTIRRFQQIVQGARGEELGEVLGAPEGQGFFWENEFGEMVFAYPGTKFLTDKLLGVPVPLTGRVQGLSMFGTIMPGLGPVAQIPAGWFLQNKPGPQQFKQLLTDVLDFDLGPLGTVEEQVLPFGSVGSSDQSDVFSAFSYVPPWMKAAGQFITGGDVNGRQWNTSVMEMAGYLKSTGRYDNSQADQQRLLQDAERAARGFYFIKALAGTTAPSSPDGEWMVETNNGRLVRAAALSTELRDMQQNPDIGYDEANNAFLDKYGENLLGIIGTSMTTSANYATPGTKDGVEWVMAHPGIEDDLPFTYGFFAPETGDTDLRLYNDDFRKGDRVRLNPQTWIRLLNDTTGNVLYTQALEEVGDEKNTDAGRAYLKDVRNQIWDQYPGWRTEKGKLGKPTTQEMITELESAVDNPAVMETDAGKGLALYLEGRSQVVEYADSIGRNWPSTSEDLAGARAYLRDDLAKAVIAQHPDFARLFDYVLSRETEEED